MHTNYKSLARDAVRHFWREQEEASRRNVKGAKSDKGRRGRVTGGKHMDGFVSLFSEIVIANGLPPENVVTKGRDLTLPGYFRPTKKWDLVVRNEEHLIAAIELKSIMSSFSNNTNNRSDEVIGQGEDLWAAFRSGTFGDGPEPFLGYFFFVKDCEETRRPGRGIKTQFPIAAVFENVSYAGRFDLICKRLMEKEIYSAASVVLSNEEAAQTGDYSEMSQETGLGRFVDALARRIQLEAG